jgi:hypothetical protein
LKRTIILTIALVCPLVDDCFATSPAPDDLTWALGTWHGSRRAEDDGQSFPMKVRVEPVADGQVERLQVELSPRPYVGFTLRYRDAASGRWTMIYANSTRETIGRLEGNLEGKRSTWESKAAGHGSRFVSEQIDASHWRRIQYVSEDAGKTWKVLFTDELERDAGK